jgi:oxygen-independent coproporphyrinogen-3 oxidase
MKAPERLHQDWFEGLKKEITLKIKSWAEYRFETVYFGGGTPSILSVDLLASVLEYLKKSFPDSFVNSSPIELNLELNPEHVNKEALQAWLDLGFNRFSIGVQSFNSKILETLGRSHSVVVAEKALSVLQNSGVDYSADLMFGLPGQTTQGFLSDLKKLCEYLPNHLSFYGLTIEEGTLFEQWEEKEKVEFPDEYNEFYLEGVKLVSALGYLRYEVSNFSKLGKESKHNSLYWNNVNYLGLGPGAHSLLEGERFGNPKHLNKWLNALESESYPEDVEVLSVDEKFSELIWLGLRQSKGVNLTYFKEFEKIKVLKNAVKYIEEGHLKYENEVLQVNNEGWLLIDQIVVDLLG